MNARRLVLLAAFVGTLVSLGVALLPNIRFVYRSPSLHVAIETSAVLIGLMAATLIFGRFRQSGATQDLLIVYVLTVLAFTNLFLSAVPNLLGYSVDEVFLAWTQTTGRVVTTEILAVAAFMGASRFKAARVAGVWVVAVSLLTLLVITVVGLAATPFLPDPLGRVVTIEAGFRPRIVGHPVFLALQLIQMALFGIAAAGFLRKADRDPGPMMPWIAAGCVLAAFSRFNYFLFPSRFTDYVYAGDVLRLGFYLCLLVGGLKEISSYWRTLADARVGETRRRLARDLHDGLAQELVFITAQTRRFVRGGAEPEQLQRLASAADRAVAESRRAINALSTGREQSLEEAIEELGEEIARRVGIKVDLDLQPVAVAPDTREALVRMVREALMNAARHASASAIRVELRDDDGPWIKVRDDGIGFDPGDEDLMRKGFGLVSLSERARALGGEAKVRSTEGVGTEVSLRVPRATPPTHRDGEAERF